MKKILMNFSENVLSRSQMKMISGGFNGEGYTCTVTCGNCVSTCTGSIGCYMVEAQEADGSITVLPYCNNGGPGPTHDRDTTGSSACKCSS